VEFSPDGAPIVTGSNVDEKVYNWPILRAPLPAPEWLPPLAEALAGQHIDAEEVGKVIPVRQLHRLRQDRLSDPGGG
jgi:hypothetical protein